MNHARPFCAPGSRRSRQFSQSAYQELSFARNRSKALQRLTQRSPPLPVFSAFESPLPAFYARQSQPNGITRISEALGRKGASDSRREPSFTPADSRSRCQVQAAGFRRVSEVVPTSCPAILGVLDQVTSPAICRVLRSGNRTEQLCPLSLPHPNGCSVSKGRTQTNHRQSQ